MPRHCSKSMLLILCLYYMQLLVFPGLGLLLSMLKGLRKQMHKGWTQSIALYATTESNLMLITWKNGGERHDEHKGFRISIGRRMVPKTRLIWSSLHMDHVLHIATSGSWKARRLQWSIGCMLGSVWLTYRSAIKVHPPNIQRANQESSDFSGILWDYL